MDPSNNGPALAAMIAAIQSVMKGIHGQLGGTLTPDASYEGRPLRDWLDGLRGEINDFLKKK